jgi:hypothetical protein
VHRLTRWLFASFVGLIVAGAAHADGFRLLELGGMRVKWGAPALGTAGEEVTYGFAGAVTRYPDALNCRVLAPADRLAVAAGGEQRLREVAAAAFGLWSGVADVRFRPARAGEVPDVTIGAQGRPDRVAFANVWPDRTRAARGVAPLARATICLNPTLAWSTDGRSGGLDLGTVLAHEIGHVIGLDHPGPTGALMGYRDQGDVDRLMAGDIAGSVVLYGAAKN